MMDVAGRSVRFGPGGLRGAVGAVGAVAALAGCSLGLDFDQRFVPDDAATEAAPDLGSPPPADAAPPPPDAAPDAGDEDDEEALRLQCTVTCESVTRCLRNLPSASRCEGMLIETNAAYILGVCIAQCVAGNEDLQPGRPLPPELCPEVAADPEVRALCELPDLCATQFCAQSGGETVLQRCLDDVRDVRLEDCRAACDAQRDDYWTCVGYVDTVNPGSPCLSLATVCWPLASYGSFTR